LTRAFRVRTAKRTARNAASRHVSSERFNIYPKYRWTTRARSGSRPGRFRRPRVRLRTGDDRRNLVVGQRLTVAVGANEFGVQNVNKREFAGRKETRHGHAVKCFLVDCDDGGDKTVVNTRTAPDAGRDGSGRSFVSVVRRTSATRNRADGLVAFFFF